MFERIKRLYDNNELSKNGLKNAVDNELITEEQYKIICGEPYDED